jgi:hypothetical protein
VFKPVLVLAALALLAGCGTAPAPVAAAPERPLTVQSATRIVHVVAFKFAPTVSQAQIDGAVAAFVKLKDESIDPHTGRKLIRSLDYGTNNSLEGLTKGFTHAFVLTFGSVADRDYYVGADHAKPFDPVHDRFKQLVGPLLDGGANGVFVIDFQDGVAARP